MEKFSDLIEPPMAFQLQVLLGEREPPSLARDDSAHPIETKDPNNEETNGNETTYLSPVNVVGGDIAGAGRTSADLCH
jgi:hypothetical protein